MLSRIKLSPQDIRHALLSLDDRLSTDDLKAIGRQLPTSDEINRLYGFEDVTRLAKPEQFFFEVEIFYRLIVNMLMSE